MQNRADGESWWARLPFGVRMTAGASAILVVTGGGAIGAAAFIDEEPGIVVNAVGQDAPAAGPAAPRLPSADTKLGKQIARGNSPDRDRTATSEPPRASAPAPRPTATLAVAPTVSGGDVPADRPVAAAAAGPVVITRTVVKKRKIPYETRLVRDRHLRLGDERVETPGIDGEKTVRFRVTYVDGRQTDRRLLKTDVTRRPQHRVVAFGTRPDPAATDDNPGADDPATATDTDTATDTAADTDDPAAGEDNHGTDDPGVDDGNWDDSGDRAGVDTTSDDDEDCWPEFGGCAPIARSEACPSEVAEAEPELPMGVDQGEHGWREGADGWHEDAGWDGPDGWNADADQREGEYQAA